MGIASIVSAVSSLAVSAVMFYTYVAADGHIPRWVKAWTIATGVTHLAFFLSLMFPGERTANFLAVAYAALALNALGGGARYVRLFRGANKI